MAISEYLLTINSKGADLRLRLKYKGGRFKSLEWISGQTANQDQYDWLMKFAPQLEPAIIILQSEWAGKVVWNKVESEKAETRYSWFIGEYCAWYEKRANLNARITGAEGKSLKSIITHLDSVCATEKEAKDTWLQILGRWNDLTPFYQSQMELRHINSNLNIILRQIGSVSKAETLDDKFKAILNK